MNFVLFVWTVVAACTGGQCEPHKDWRVLTTHNDSNSCLATAAALQLSQSRYRCIALSNGYTYTPTGANPPPPPTP